MASSTLLSLRDRWLAAWPQALACWSRHTRLREPVLCLDNGAAVAEGLQGSFAMIRLRDQAIVVNLAEVASRNLGDYAVEVLAHEIGHHVLAPATLTDHLRMLARMQRALPTLKAHAPMLANLYTDLLINDRLQRGAELRLADVYRALRSEGKASGAVWTLYVRIYEVLWSLPRGSLGGGETDDRLEGDAWLGARLIRVYARDLLRGSGRFAALLLPYLVTDAKHAAAALAGWHDTRGAGAGGEPVGAVEEDADERDAPHPASDPVLTGEDAVPDADQNDPERRGHRLTPASVQSPVDQARGQAREPFEYGQILRSAGLNLTDHEVAVRYYRERARPHLIAFPRRPRPEGTDPLPEGLEPWDIGQPFDQIDWLQSLLLSPSVIPGMTLVQRTWGVSEGATPSPLPLDLDLYVDSSGSMPNPQVRVSYLALAGAILCLSALRAGGRVQVTLWSGRNQFMATPGFCRDEFEILRVLTGFFGGGTQFPLHRLRETFAGRRPTERPAHVMVISDDGVSTMFDSDDEKGTPGWTVAARALAQAGGGGTLVLNLPENWERDRVRPHTLNPYATIQRARDQHGWQVHAVATWEQLVRFAREFSRRRFARDDEAQPTTAAGRGEP
ncbi:MAG: VWA domain-containing protein [Opitutaceae bacterium]|nr:VWA domain-containing protein [Opitutaceae bacterium]